MITRHAPYAGLLHEVVVHHGTLYFAGIVSEDLSLDMAGQAADVFRQLDILLAANGSDRDHVLSVTVYLAKLAEKEAFNAVWRAFFTPASLPARAAFAVGDLGPDVRLEIVAIAAAAA